MTSLAVLFSYKKKDYLEFLKSIDSYKNSIEEVILYDFNYSFQCNKKIVGEYFVS